MEEQKKEDVLNFVVTKSYPKYILTSMASPTREVNENIVRFDIETLKPLPPEFDRNLAELIEEYTTEPEPLTSAQEKENKLYDLKRMRDMLINGNAMPAKEGTYHTTLNSIEREIAELEKQDVTQ